MTEVLSNLSRSPQGAIGLLLVGLVMLVVLFGPLLAPFDPEQFHFGHRFEGPGSTFLLGTDQFGRDIFSRLLHGARPTVIYAIAATLLGTALGAVVGTASAYIGGRVDEFLMRVVDAVMAIPSLLFALLIVTVLGTGAFNAFLAIGITFTPGMARIARSVALTVRRLDYVNAAIARGETASYIILREMLPNVLAPVVVETTIRVAFAIMLLATLSFLGLGAQPPSSEWGLMVSEARSYLFRNAWMIVAPGVAIAMVAIGFNLLGDGLRDALNPRH